ncbi:hypothetical protein [Mycolicibacterium celeriflavum]|uniref:hypothetical protein n=1 Tax=Mycolicibacterium celeriflavum TaxID=1249101 RepID=UPI003CE86533
MTATSADDQPQLSIAYHERNLCLWIGVDALAAARIAEGPNGPAAPFLIAVDEAHALLGALHAAIDDRDDLRIRDNTDGWLDD